MNYSVEAVIQALTSEGGMVIDNHTRDFLDTPLYGYAIYSRGEGKSKTERVVALYADGYFTVNPLYVSVTGRVHLSTTNCGGTVVPMDHKGDVKAACESYKDLMGGKLSNVTIKTRGLVK